RPARPARSDRSTAGASTSTRAGRAGCAIRRSGCTANTSGASSARSSVRRSPRRSAASATATCDNGRPAEPSPPTASSSASPPPLRFPISQSTPWWPARRQDEMSDHGPGPPSGGPQRQGRRGGRPRRTSLRKQGPYRIGLFGYLGSGNIGNDASMESMLGYLRSAHPDAVVDAMCTGPEHVSLRYGLEAEPLFWYLGLKRPHHGVARFALKSFSKIIDLP